MNNPTTTTTLTTGEAAAAGALVGGFMSTFIISMIVLYVFIIIAGWKIFKKAGEPGWKAIIPIYNFYILYKIVDMKGWFWATLAASLILSIVLSVNMGPTVYVASSSQIVAYNFGANPGVIITFIATLVISIWAGIMCDWRLSKVFGHGAGYFIGLFFLPVIFWLVLGFDSSKYNKKLLKK